MNTLSTPAVLFLSCICVLFSVQATAYELHSSVQSLSNEVLRKHNDKGLLLLGVIELSGITDGKRTIAEFSGLGWDDDENILYAVSDKGSLVHLRPSFSGIELTGVELIDVHVLRNRADEPLTGNFIDSEGLTTVNQNNGVNGDTELLIPFEIIPRIDRYSSSGRYLGSESIPGFLKRIENYDNRNSELESITRHPVLGIITAPEKLSAQYPADRFQLYSLAGEKWSFPNVGGEHGAITGLTVTANRNILALERIFVNIFMGIRFALHHIRITDAEVNHRTLFDIGPVDGYFNENFEGIVHHRDNRYFMISDNNNTALQRSLLIYFALPGLEE